MADLGPVMVVYGIFREIDETTSGEKLFYVFDLGLLGVVQTVPLFKRPGENPEDPANRKLAKFLDRLVVGTMVKFQLSTTARAATLMGYICGIEPEETHTMRLSSKDDECAVFEDEMTRNLLTYYFADYPWLEQVLENVDSESRASLQVELYGLHEVKRDTIPPRAAEPVEPPKKVEEICARMLRAKLLDVKVLRS